VKKQSKHVNAAEKHTRLYRRRG